MSTATFQPLTVGADGAERYAFIQSLTHLPGPDGGVEFTPGPGIQSAIPTTIVDVGGARLTVTSEPVPLGELRGSRDDVTARINQARDEHLNAVEAFLASAQKAA